MYIAIAALLEQQTSWWHGLHSTVAPKHDGNKRLIFITLAKTEFLVQEVDSLCINLINQFVFATSQTAGSLMR